MKAKLLVLVSVFLVLLMSGCGTDETKTEADKTSETEKSNTKVEDQVENKGQVDNQTEEENKVDKKAVKNKSGLPIEFKSIEDLAGQYQWTDAGQGMKYMEVKVGSGDEVKENDFIDAYYTLWLPDGKPFQSNKYSLDGAPDSSLKPFNARLSYGSLIDGWVKLVQGMKVGGVRRLIIPPELAYGSQDNRGIPGGSTLVFELEIVGVVHSISEEQARSEKLPISFNTVDELAAKFNWKEAEGGMKYMDVKVGTGRTVKEDDAIKAYYTLWLPDGTPFQSNRYLLEGANPAHLVPFDSVLSHGRLITGWVKLVQGMKDGGVRRLIIPSEFAYGPDDNNGIPGGSTLVFELQIVKSSSSR